jgi:hypothetical protein
MGTLDLTTLITVQVFGILMIPVITMKKVYGVAVLVAPIPEVAGRDRANET